MGQRRGKCPRRLLEWGMKYCIELQLPMPLGIGPSKLFFDISKKESKPKLLILWGILPESLFESKNKYFNEWSFPIPLGIVPVRLLFER